MDATAGPRMVDSDDILGLIERLREEHPERAWPTDRQAKAAVLATFQISVGNDRLRALLNEARNSDLPTDHEADGSEAHPLASAERIRAQAAKAARDRRWRRKVEAMGHVPDQTDDLRRLFARAVQQARASDDPTEQIIAPLIRAFEQHEQSRVALLTKPDLAAAVAARAPEPDVGPDDDPDDLELLSLEVAIAQAKAAELEPDTAPDVATGAFAFSGAIAPDDEPDDLDFLTV
ncbi:hypothetical protein QWZ14_16745 [Paeniroseomonas aquatica]|uniref:Uncharacterized protein n=1 Tax=Paeniroseomonas aquatica TaxID=373043 RepID=A0ABT8A879_9PROT|nr:hypothetical protein [Paeniroseomonas aquatica]MDN3566019.1 hypothetical protein [Paeniroseomonas aquatica]